MIVSLDTYSLLGRCWRKGSACSIRYMATSSAEQERERERERERESILIKLFFVTYGHKLSWWLVQLWRLCWYLERNDGINEGFETVATNSVPSKNSRSQTASTVSQQGREVSKHINHEVMYSRGWIPISSWKNRDNYTMTQRVTACNSSTNAC